MISDSMGNGTLMKIGCSVIRQTCGDFERGKHCSHPG